jgi:hypothetical protein
MALQVLCPHCNHPNSVGKVFCGACGGNMQAAGKPPRIITDGPTGTPFTRLLRFLFAVAAIVVPVALLLFLLNPRPGTGTAGKPLHAREYDKSLERLRYGLQSSAEPFYLDFTEEQLNARLARALASAPASSGFGFVVRGVNLDLLGGKDDPAGPRVRVTMMAVMKDKLKLSHQAEVRLRAGENGLETELISAHLGQVPMPFNLKKLLVGQRIAQALAQGREERELLTRARAVQIADGAVRIVFAPRRNS